MWTTTLALALLGAASGQDTPDATKALSADELREAFVELEDAYGEAQQEFYAAANAAWEAFQESDDQSGGFQMPDAIEPTWFPGFDDLAAKGSVDAEVWCIQNHGGSGLEGATARLDKTKRYRRVLSEKRRDEILTALTRPLTFDAESAPDGEVWGVVDGEPVRIGREAAFGFLDAIFEMANGDELRAQTLFSRGQALIPYGASGEKAKAGMVFYRRAAAEYPKTPIGQRCVGLVFAADHLQIGQKAPDIVGKDHDGNELKLSDFAGKVTVIDFWGFW